MAKAELGTKRIDPETGRKFYDLNKDPIVSPYTGKSYPRSYFEDGKISALEEDEEVADKEVDGEDEEGAEVDIVLVIAKIGKIVAALDFLVGVFERDNLDALFLLGVDFLLGDFLFLLDGGGLAFLEIGTRIRLAGIGRDDRVLVQVIEFPTRFRIYAFGAKFRFCHSKPRR